MLPSQLSQPDILSLLLLLLLWTPRGLGWGGGIKDNTWKDCRSLLIDAEVPCMNQTLVLLGTCIVLLEVRQRPPPPPPYRHTPSPQLGSLTDHTHGLLVLESASLAENTFGPRTQKRTQAKATFCTIRVAHREPLSLPCAQCIVTQAAPLQSPLVALFFFAQIGQRINQQVCYIRRYPTKNGIPISPSCQKPNLYEWFSLDTPLSLEYVWREWSSHLWSMAHRSSQSGETWRSREGGPPWTTQTRDWRPEWMRMAEWMPQWVVVSPPDTHTLRHPGISLLELWHNPRWGRMGEESWIERGVISPV